MKIAFYSPMKPVDHPNPSGDREIARGLYGFFGEGAEVFVLSGFRSRFFYRSPFGWVAWSRALLEAILRARREKPDVFFTYHTYYKAPDAIGFLLARASGKPYFLFEAIYGRKSARRGLNWIGYWINRAALSYATQIYCAKSEDFAFMRRWYPEKTSYVPPSLRLSGFRRAHGNELPVVATVAMLRPGRKSEGVKLLVRCLARLRREGVAFRWRLAGGGEELAGIRELAARELGEAEILGTIDTIPDFLAGADLFAFPGIGEGFGLSFVEAQAAGLPVVAFRGAGAMDSVSEGESGILTPFMDEAAYCEALRTLIQDSALRQRMGQAAVAHASRFEQGKNYGAILAALKAASEN